jgi:peptide deformylase
MKTLESSNKILLLGDPRLYEVSQEIKREECKDLQQVVESMHNAMMDFRAKYKRGRAIAAPQIGVMKRLMYMHIDKPVVFINPVFTWKSAELMELWDDCMSFPDLLVKVLRHQACRIKFRDLDWTEHEMDLAGDLSELLQHEYDHLDGILAVMRAIDDKSLALYSQKQYISFSR